MHGPGPARCRGVGGAGGLAPASLGRVGEKRAPDSGGPTPAPPSLPTPGSPLPPCRLPLPPVCLSVRPLVPAPHVLPGLPSLHGPSGRGRRGGGRRTAREGEGTASAGAPRRPGPCPCSLPARGAAGPRATCAPARRPRVTLVSVSASFLHPSPEFLVVRRRPRGPATVDGRGPERDWPAAGAEER